MDALHEEDRKTINGWMSNPSILDMNQREKAVRPNAGSEARHLPFREKLSLAVAVYRTAWGEEPTFLGRLSLPAAAREGIMPEMDSLPGRCRRRRKG
jgi:hypothetical protein